MKRRAYKLVSILLVAVFVLCCIPPVSVQAATEEDKEEFRKELVKMIETNDTTIHDVRRYHLTTDDYLPIFDSIWENEGKYLKIACPAQRFELVEGYAGEIRTFKLFCNDEQCRQNAETLKGILDTLHSEMQGMSDLDKLIYAYDYIVQNTTYNLNAKRAYDAVGPLLYGEGVCAGYAIAMELILENEGIESKNVYNPTHMWLAVKLDGEWYHIDPTWGDTRSRQKPKTDYRFLLCNDNEFKTGDRNHGAIEDLPISSSTKYSNWYVHDIVGTMLYNAGYWYYMKDGSIVKNNAQGTAYEAVVQGDNLEIVGIKNGVLTYKENGLEKTKTLSAPVHQHTVVADKAVEATCTKEGKTEGSHCSVCNEVIKAQETVPKKAHTEVTVKPAEEATCTKEGKTAEIQCSVCKEIIQKQETVEKKAHTEVTLKPAEEATCTKEGKTAEIQCSVCKDLIQKQETVEKKEHTIVIDEAVAPTTETEGKTEGKHCSVCDEVLVAQEVIPKLTGDNTTGWVTKDGKKYYVNEDGTNKTGWFLLDGNYYYFDTNGVMQTGWEKVGRKWYYLNDEGIMQTGWVQDGNNWYYLNADGSMKTGWLKDGKNWYYLGSSGVMVTGWFNDGGKWYYLGSNGAMQLGWVKVAGKWYYLGDFGSMVTGWIKQNNIWYYLSGNGAMLDGWQKISGKWYYFYNTGKMAANTKIGSYYVNANGEWVK